MKKNVFLRAGIILLCLITAFAGLPVCAEESEKTTIVLTTNNFSYNVFFNETLQRYEIEIYSIYNIHGTNLCIELPNKIKTYVQNLKAETDCPITRIAAKTFRYVGGIAELVIPAGVSYISPRAFLSSDIGSYSISPENDWYKTEGGVIFSKDGKTLIAYPTNSETGIYSVPDATEHIGDYAFFEVRNIIQVNLPSSVTKIGVSAFEDCSSLAGVYIPESVVNIDKNAFSGCGSMRSIYVPMLRNTSVDDIFDNSSIMVYTPEGSSLLGDFANVRAMNKRATAVKAAPSKTKYIENTGGHYGEKSYQYDLGSFSVELTFSDNTTEYFQNNWNFEEKYGFYLYGNSNQYEEPWDIGFHDFYISAFGITTTAQIEVVKSTVESAEMQNVEITERTGGAYDSELGCYVYEMRNLITVKVSFNNGSEDETMTLAEYIQLCCYSEYEVYTDTDNSVMADWRAGGEYNYSFKLRDERYTVTVKIIPSEYDTLTLKPSNLKSEYLPGEIPELENMVIEISASSGKAETQSYTVHYADYGSNMLYCHKLSGGENKQFEFAINNGEIYVYEYWGAPKAALMYKTKTDSDGNEITVSDVQLKKQPDDINGSGAIFAFEYSNNETKEIEVPEAIYNYSSFDESSGKMKVYMSGFFKYENGIFPFETVRTYENSITSELEFRLCGESIMWFDSEAVKSVDRENLSTNFAYLIHLYGVGFNGSITEKNIESLISLLLSQNRFYYEIIDEQVISVKVDDVNTAISDIFDVDLSKGDAKLSQYYNSESGCLEINGGGFGDDFVLKLYKERNHGDGNTSYECIFGHFEEEDSREAVSISLKDGKIAAVSRFVSCGDANADGIIDILDLVRTKKIIAGTASAECAEFAADTNGSGEVNAEDLAWLRYMLINAEK